MRIVRERNRQLRPLSAVWRHGSAPSQMTMEPDQSYKLLFSHARMVEDLVRGFSHEPSVPQVDFATLEQVNSSFVRGDLREREDDVIWRVRWRQEC